MNTTKIKLYPFLYNAIISKKLSNIFSFFTNYLNKKIGEIPDEYI